MWLGHLNEFRRGRTFLKSHTTAQASTATPASAPTTIPTTAPVETPDPLCAALLAGRETVAAEADELRVLEEAGTTTTVVKALAEESDRTNEEEADWQEPRRVSVIVKHWQNVTKDAADSPRSSLSSWSWLRRRNGVGISKRLAGAFRQSAGIVPCQDLSKTLVHPCKAPVPPMELSNRTTRQDARQSRSKDAVFGGRPGASSRPGSDRGKKQTRTAVTAATGPHMPP